MKKTNQKGFTLIELLVVIAIIGLLSTMAVVSLNSARQKARDAKRVSDVKQISTVLQLAASENPDAVLQCNVTGDANDAYLPCTINIPSTNIVTAISNGVVVATDPDIDNEMDKYFDPSLNLAQALLPGSACDPTTANDAAVPCQYSLNLTDGDNTTDGAIITFMTEGNVGTTLTADCVHTITAEGIMTD